MKRPSPRLVVPLLLLVIAALIVVPIVRRAATRGRLVASGTVEATEAQLGFQVPGRIDSIFVLEGDRVRAGQVLATLDRVQARAAREQVAASLAAARAQLEELRRGATREEVAQAQAARDAGRQRLADAQLDFQRMEQLARSNVVSQQTFDKARTTLDVARAQATQSDEQYRQTVIGPRRERIDAARAQVAQAEAALAGADAGLANMVIRAPFDGVVTVKDRDPGEIVPAGSAVVNVMNPGDRWVRIYVSEDRVGALRLGQPASITSDTFRGRNYPGRVVYVSSVAEFTPKNVQTSEERVKLVYAVKVQITGDPGDQLKPGMPADVRLALAR